MSVINDAGTTKSSFTPGKLNYTITGQASGFQSFLVQRVADGAFFIGMWQDANLPSPTGTTSTSRTNVTVTLNDGSTHNVSVFDPTVGTTATATHSAVTS